MDSDFHVQLGAALAPDGIPLHYGQLAAEYSAFAQSAVLLDRRHEGRLRVRGADRQAWLHRMSTNAITSLQPHEACVTLFLTPQGRILERAFVYNHMDEVILISEAGRGEALESLLRRNIFFQDQVTLENITPSTAHFAVHGPHAEAFIRHLHPEMTELPMLLGRSITVEGIPITAIRRKAVVGAHWALLCAAEEGRALHEALLRLGEPFDLRPAGSLAYHGHRVRVGYPAGREVSSDYIPLEVGLWDDLHFGKGCYTGQEIIARMESRERLARLLVTLTLNQMMDAPASVSYEGREVGTLTSSAQTPDGNIFGLAVVKRETALITPRPFLSIGTAQAQMTGYGGVYPPFIDHL